MTSSTYATPTAFRQALEARLNGIARQRHVDVQRLRRQVAFDRFLCRLFQHAADRWLLKGGYAMELRLRESRTTRDIDLATRGPIRGSGPLSDRILRLLQDAVSLDVGDHFAFAVGIPMQDLAGASSYSYPCSYTRILKSRLYEQGYEYGRRKGDGCSRGR